MNIRKRLAMLEKLYPDVYKDSVFDIDYEGLRAGGIKALIFDIDNTLAPYDIKRPPKKIVRLLNRLQKDFQICLLSNNNEKRVRLFNEELKLSAVFSAAKPTAWGVSKAMGMVKATPGNTALIGDQIFTDVLCGKNNGLFTILVKPISERDEVLVRIKRTLERLVIKRYLLKKGTK